MKLVKSVILIGYRGTGKTTVARLLADRLGWDWEDADAYLENKYGQSVKEVFDQEGETGFRDKEAMVLSELCERTQVVLACGGGVVTRAENRDRLRQMGNVVWLTADAKTIWNRLQSDPATARQRPPLTMSGGLAEIESLLASREPLYRECAEIVVDTVGRSPEDVAEEIITKLLLA